MVGHLGFEERWRCREAVADIVDQDLDLEPIDGEAPNGAPRIAR